jgi:hypothetical protein
MASVTTADGRWTPNGLTLSFSLAEDLSQELGEAHLKGSGYRAKAH